MQIVGDARVAKFVGERVGSIIYPPFTCLGIEKDNEIVAGAVFNCFSGNDVEVTIAGQGWTRGFIREVGRYVFDQLGCLRISITTEQPKVVSFAERLGGAVEGMKPDFYGEGRDAFLVGIRKKDFVIR